MSSFVATPGKMGRRPHTGCDKSELHQVVPACLPVHQHHQVLPVHQRHQGLPVCHPHGYRRQTSFPTKCIFVRVLLHQLSVSYARQVDCSSVNPNITVKNGEEVTLVSQHLFPGAQDCFTNFFHQNQRFQCCFGSKCGNEEIHDKRCPDLTPRVESNFDSNLESNLNPNLDSNLYSNLESNFDSKLLKMCSLTIPSMNDINSGNYQMFDAHGDLLQKCNVTMEPQSPPPHLHWAAIFLLIAAVLGSTFLAAKKIHSAVVLCFALLWGFALRCTGKDEYSQSEETRNIEIQSE